MLNRTLLAAMLATGSLIGPPAIAQDEPAPTEPAVEPTIDPASQPATDPVTEPQPDAEEAIPEVTIGQPAPGTDPLAERDRPDAAEPQGGDRPEGEEQMVLGVPESELRVDPRTLGIAPGEPMPRLLREGEFIRNRDVRLIPTGERGYAVVIIEPAADAEPGSPRSAMIVAPNRMLESMESLQRDRGDDLRFTLSGQVHTYRGTNYLMVTSLPRPWLVGAEEQPEPELAQQQPEPTEATADPAIPNNTPGASGGTSGGNSGGGEATSDDVLDDLLNQRREVPTPVEPDPAEDPDDTLEMNEINAANAPTVHAGPLITGVAPDQDEPKLYDEGTFIIRRSARLIRSGDGSHPLLVFEADDAASPEPPMVVQNCKLLEEMEAIIQTHGDHTPFVVTGQVQTYRGTNYLLPSIAKLEFDRQNIE